MKRFAVFPVTLMPVLAKISKCRSIHTNLVLYAAIFTAPPFTMVIFLAAIDALDAAQAAMSQGGQDRTAVRNAAEAALNGMITQLKNYVNDVADGDVVKLTRSGFSLNKERQPSGLTPQMVITSVKPGPVSGSLDIVCQSVKDAKMYYLSYSEADNAGNPGTWTADVQFTKSKMLLGGLNPRKLYWVRVRALANQSLGAYSNPVAGSTV